MAVLITQGTQTAIATDTEGTLNYQVINVNKGTISSIGTLPNIPGGSVVVTSGTVASGSITVTQGTIVEGTLRNLISGTINSATAVLNSGILS